MDSAARRRPLLPGFRLKIIDGNCIEASEHRIEELRYTKAGALPGKSLAVYDPSLKLVLDVYRCEDGYTQERALLSEVLSGVEAGDLSVADRNFCTRTFFFGIADRDGFFLIREHKQLPWTALSSLAKVAEEVSGYYIADEIAGTYRGMLIAIPLEHWAIFCVMTGVELASALQDLAGRIRLSAFKKHPRGPKKKPPRRHSNKQEPHVSTARLIAQRRSRNQTP